jgi:hypothetical protein
LRWERRLETIVHGMLASSRDVRRLVGRESDLAATTADDAGLGRLNKT